MREAGADFIPASVIAGELLLDSVQVRKDLAMTGIIGTPKKGFPARDLITAIEHFLGWDVTSEAVLIGAGNLGSALLGYRGFPQNGLRIVAAFDTKPSLIGTEVHGIKILNIAEAEKRIGETGAKIAVLAVPPECAQESAERLARAGITGIWNFTRVKLRLPEDVAVLQEDLSTDYAVLSVMMRFNKD